MTLPQNVLPIYTITIPSSKKEFKYRPFLVKEEKALMLAQQSKNVNVILDTIKDTISSCAKSQVNLESLASFDIEYMFLQIRAKSIGEIVTLLFACDIDHGKDNPKARATVNVNLEEAHVVFQENHQSKFTLFDNVGICMKYPSFEVLKKIEASKENEQQLALDIIIDCIDYIYDDEQVYWAKDTSKEELITFLENLTSSQFQHIIVFFNTLPSVRIDVSYDCPVCNLHHDKYIEGLSSFF